jgi:hypothetical protein
MSFLRTLEYTKFLFCLLHNLHCRTRQDNFLFSLARSATWEFPVVTCLIEKAYISYNGWKREKEIWTNELRVVKLVYNDSTLERDAKSKRCQRLNLLVDSYFFFIFFTSFLNLLFCSLSPEISNDSRCSFALLVTGQTKEIFSVPYLFVSLKRGGESESSSASDGTTA